MDGTQLSNSHASNDDFVTHERAVTIVTVQEETRAQEIFVSSSTLHTVEPLKRVVDLLASLQDSLAN